jgi:uncharacterized membrane protein YdjX (TVP38/TMEM64 family)
MADPIKMSENLAIEDVEDADTKPLLADDKAPQSPIRPWLPYFARFLLISILIAVVILTIVFRSNVLSGLDIVLHWIQSLGIYGAILLVFVYMIATVTLFPPFLLTLAGGFLYGYPALIIDTVGATLGSSLAFLLGKYTFRGWIEKKIKEYPKFDIVDRAIHAQGFKIVALLRLCPLFPDSVCNYILAMTDIKFIPFVLGTVVGMFPGTCFLVYIGNTAKSLKDILEGHVGPSWKAEIILFIISGFVIVIFFIVTLRVAQNVLNEILAKQQEKLDDEILNDPSTINDLEESEEETVVEGQDIIIK